MRLRKREEVSLERQITRANGTVEEAALVAYSHPNPLKTFWVRLRSPHMSAFRPMGRIRRAA